MQILTRRNPELLLLAAVVMFAATFGWRVIRDRGPQTSVATGPARAPVELSAADTLAAFQDRVRQRPDDPAAYAALGLAYLERVRVTADPALYGQAEQALDEAIKRDPQQFDALIGQGLLSLARHDFADALEWGERARAVNPLNAQVFGIIGDAQTELGQYDQAAQSIQQMVDIRPDINSYTRVSYQRELRGDMNGAVEAMTQAVRSSNPNSEATWWTIVQLGNLHFNRGDLVQAKAVYEGALAVAPDYRPAQAGLARIQAAQGDIQGAIAAYEQLVAVLPMPEYVIQLGELYEVDGQRDAAQKQYDLVRTIQKLNQSAGMNVDLELALFEADHGDPQIALEQARRAYAKQPNVHSADVLAWALYHAGQPAEARQWSEKALALGTHDAMLYFHAGMIAHAVGDQALAKKHLERARTINPHFSLRYAPVLETTLANLK
jgi:tetratricopeptide (TPR) repeat protein